VKTPEMQCSDISEEDEESADDADELSLKPCRNENPPSELQCR